MKKMLVAMLMATVLGMVVTGCASTPKGPSDEELIQKTIGDWKAAAVAKDLDKLLLCYSESFQHYEWGNKAGLKGFLKDTKDMGYLDNATVSSDKAQTKMDAKKGEAAVGPIELKAAFGGATIELVLKKEANAWLITGMSVEEN